MITKVRVAWRQWRRILESYQWTCYHCRHANETPVLLWQSLKYYLICRYCRYMQSYPDHIRQQDPEPPSFD
jgi:hypothetical protein